MIKQRIRPVLPALYGLIFAVWSACSTTESPPKTSGDSNGGRAICRADQVREVYCDGLLPMATSRGAPTPYETCPAGLESPPGVQPTTARVASFDAPYTEWARRRAQPGHTCCYSWCADVEVAAMEHVLPYAGCAQPDVMSEGYCMPELESGTSAPAPEPFHRCPVAIRPPEAAAFSVPKAAPLDIAASTARRAQGDTSCCYNWCSRMPPGMQMPLPLDRRSSDNAPGLEPSR